MADLVAVRVPRFEANDEFVRIVAWLVPAGQVAEAGQPVVVVETSKSTAEVAAPARGVVQPRAASADDVRVGDILFHLADVNEDGATAATPVDAGNEGPRFSDKARALLESSGLDPALFQGMQLVTVADVTARLAGNKPQGSVPAEVHEAPADGLLPTERERLSPRKLAEIAAIRQGHGGGLISTVAVACPGRDLRRVTQAHPVLNGRPLPLILHESARLLRQFPLLNAYYEEGCAHRYRDIHLGFAIDSGGNLKVPVIENADQQSLAELAAAVDGLVERYVENQLSSADLGASTFTVSDLSTEGACAFVPMLNGRQSAILGIGSFVPGDDERGTFNLILSFDHRVTEGKYAVGFLQALAARLRAFESALESTSPPAEKQCSRCLRSQSELARLGGFLVRSELPRGYLCHFCLAGW